MCQNAGYYKDVLVLDASHWWCSWLHLELYFITSSARYVGNARQDTIGSSIYFAFCHHSCYTFLCSFPPINWDGNVNQIQSLPLPPHSSEIGSPVCKHPVLIVFITSCYIQGNLLTRFNMTFQSVKEAMEFSGLYL